MELSHLTQEFYMDLRLKNRTPATIKSYRWYLNRFLKYLDEEDILYLDQLDSEVLKRYQMQLTLGRAKPAARGQLTPIPISCRSGVSCISSKEPGIGPKIRPTH